MSPVTKVKKGKRITGSTRTRMAADLKKKYEKGASIRTLARLTGRSYGFVHRILSESGVQLRARGGSLRRRPSQTLRTARSSRQIGAG
jgi:predicted transcriptional regulator